MTAAAQRVVPGMPGRREVTDAADAFGTFDEPVAQFTTTPDVVGGGWFERDTEARHLRMAQWYVEVSPGAIRLGRKEAPKPEPVLARRELAKGLRDRARAAEEPCWEECLSERCGACVRERARRVGKIGAWSAKSRRSMIYRLATLDYSPLFVNDWGEETRPAMVTLTYPGDWQAVAPSNRVVVGHVKALRKRWNREWAHLGYPLVGVWKREFQRRGAPHYHVMCVPPPYDRFREWLSETWAEIVGAESCGRACWVARDGRPSMGLACCEYGRHVVAGTGVDFREGARASDPCRFAVYFSKHGGYAAKEYQNNGPALWVGRGGVGRFWGVWGLDVATDRRGLDEVTYNAVARALRRHQYAARRVIPVPVAVCGRSWQADPETGELHQHHPRCYDEKDIVVRRFTGSAGYVVVNDGPAVAAMLARVSAAVLEDARRPEAMPWDRWWSSTGRRRGPLP